MSLRNLFVKDAKSVASIVATQNKVDDVIEACGIAKTVANLFIFDDTLDCEKLERILAVHIINEFNLAVEK
jgi:hypothetical protein